MNNLLKQHVQEIKKLPTLPVIAQEVLELVDKKLMSVEKLENIIQNDPAISAKVLSVSNSVYFGIAADTQTLSSAIMRIGFDNIKNIAFGVSLMSVMKDDQAGSVFDYQMLFNHSVSVGFVARIIAKELKLEVSEEMLMNGLIHDLGYLVMNKYFPKRYREVINVFEKEKQLLAAEKEVFDFTHADIGAWLADQWKLPGNILDTVMYHHSPSLAEKHQKSVAIIHIADFITTKSIIGPTKVNPNYPFDPAALEIMELSKSDLNEFEAKVSGGIYSD
jgi:putative nucleotidyltransferase with HDIG domain